MILDRSLRLEAVLAGAVATSQPEVIVDYVDWNENGESTPPATVRSPLNSTTDVTILSAPVGNPKREPLHLSIYNKDTANVTVTVKSDDGTTERIEVKQTLAAAESLCWAKTVGWYVI